MKTPILILCLAGWLYQNPALACCSVSSQNVPAINADQTVILLWDKERQMEHFIRKASFRSQGDSVGFLVPSPSRPQLEESGNEAFPYLAEITTPPASISGGFPLGCSVSSDALRSPKGVRVIEEKTLAGYETVVLAADSGEALVKWLKEHQYAYTPEVATWAQPYLEQKWYMIAMKIAKQKNDKQDSNMAASALRISFKTDHPLFPYREPDSRSDAAALGIKDRILRIYFVAEAKYDGNFSTSQAWTGKMMWSHPLSNEQRSQLLAHLKLDQNTGPAAFWLSEFVDHWPYGIAPGDVYFSRSADQGEVGQSTFSWSLDPAFPCVLALGLLWSKRRR
ncbi:MAG: DUF2330 domain-containing protein [Gloeobacteraceae cyanobacterium ES-bin-144]|nr:DUF2330 domain-containing protein [Verrucomicrobiales bacterium]